MPSNTTLIDCAIKLSIHPSYNKFFNLCQNIYHAKNTYVVINNLELAFVIRLTQNQGDAIVSTEWLHCLKRLFCGFHCLMVFICEWYCVSSQFTDLTLSWWRSWRRSLSFWNKSTDLRYKELMMVRDKGVG